jgi:hypothetical protein
VISCVSPNFNWNLIAGQSPSHLWAKYDRDRMHCAENHLDPLANHHSTHVSGTYRNDRNPNYRRKARMLLEFDDADMIHFSVTEAP